MAPEYQAFTEEFCRFMRQRTGWPQIKHTSRWFREQEEGFKPAHYTALKRGEAVNVKYPAGLIRMLADRQKYDPNDHSIVVVNEYLAGKGIDEALQAPTDTILECLQDSSKEPVGFTGSADFMQQGLSVLSLVLNTRRTVDRLVQGCKPETTLLSAVQWIYVSLGRTLPPGESDLKVNQAIERAERAICLSMSDYVENARRWLAVSPWTIALARGAKRPNGVTIMLPLKKEAYDAVLNGERLTSECQPSDLTMPSQHLLVEAVAERPVDLGRGRSNPTKALYAALVAQASVLSYSGEIGAKKEVRLLGVAGTPTNVKRMKAAGYRATGKRAKQSGVEFYEQVLSPQSKSALTGILLGTLRHFGSVIDSPPAD